MALRMFTAVRFRKRGNLGVEREVEEDQSGVVEDEALVAHA